MLSYSLRFSFYHKTLRILCAVFTLVLIFDSGLLVPESKELSLHTQNYLASAIGINASVAPNELNVLTARITELEQELATKDREIAVTLSSGTPTTSTIPTSTIVLSIILFILLVLIVLNYALDYLRLKQPSEQGRQLQQA
jgi:hypothetical protein